MASAAQTADFGIPALAAVLDPAELASHLRFFSYSPWRWGQLNDLNIQVLKCHPGSRCTVEIRLRTDRGTRRLIGKVYTSGGLDVYHAMKRISRAGFGVKAQFSIPEPLAFLPNLNLLVQEYVLGRVAEDLFLSGNSANDGEFAALRCAQWLAHFHTRAPKAGLVFEVGDHLIAVDRWARRLADLGQPFTDKAIRILRLLERRAMGLAAGDTCPGHGSYCHTQIMIAGARTVTFDWDGHDVADPSRDVARFIASLKRLALGRLGSVRAFDREAELFLQTYLEVSRLEVRPNLPFYEAAACIKLAKYEISRRPDGWRPAIVEAMLDEALWIVDQ